MKETLGTFRILEKLGEGGMGEVYRAQDTRLNRQVAIKVLPDSHVADPDRIARFEREAQAVAALSHRNIAAIFEFADAGDVKFLVLELIEGDTLADRIKRGPVPVDEAIAIARQILEALESAHERGICHRDLKPANIKLSAGSGGEPPTVKVLDFGLAKFVQTGAPSPYPSHSPTFSLAGTYPGVILGTAGYMSPEQANGYEADQRSDIFSFGCVFYELLTGRQAFEGSTASEILASVLKSDVDFAALPPRLNPRITEILRRCLEKNPKKRWHSAADVRVELEAVMGQALVVDDPRASSPARLPLWKRLVPVAAGVLAGALAGAYAMRALTPEAPRPATRFTLTLPADQRFSSTGRQFVALSPDGRNLVYVANERLFLRTMSSLEARAIAGSEMPNVSNPVFSPDGQSLVFRADGTLKRLAVAGGAAMTICPADVILGMTWSEHGILFGQAGKGILKVSPNGGVPEVLVASTPEEVLAAPEMLPDGRAVILSVKKPIEHWDTGRVVLQPLDGGARRTLIEGGADGRILPTGHLAYSVGGMLLAVPWDTANLAVAGGPVPIVEGVRRSGGSGAASSPAAQFSFARDGGVVYVPGPVGSTRGVRTDLAIFDRKTLVQPLNLPPGPYRAPRVSPNRKAIAVETDDDPEASVWVYDLDGKSAIRRLTFGGKNRAPVWSPDSMWIAFQSDREGDLAIFRQRADGSGTAERLTKPEKNAVHMPQSWSPDGRYLLFTVRVAAQPLALVLLDSKDGTTTPFGGVQSPDNLEAMFSPDGRWIVYHSRETGRNQAFVQPFPATGAKYEVPQGGGAPYWTRKGSELVFNINPAESSVVAFTPSPSVSFGSPIRFTRNNMEGNPMIIRRNTDPLDDERYVGVMAAGATESSASASQMIVVLNWLEEVKRKFSR